jgi:hypothetical protein
MKKKAGRRGACRGGQLQRPVDLRERPAGDATDHIGQRRRARGEIGGLARVDIELRETMEEVVADDRRQDFPVIAPPAPRQLT